MDEPIVVSIHDKFEEFFVQREAEKLQLYQKIVYIGWFTFCAAVLLGFPGIFIWYTAASGGALWFIGIAMAVVGSFLFSGGICIVSTIPPSEFDIDTEISKRPTTRLVLRITVAITSLILGGVFSFFVPYFGGILVFLVGITVLLGDIFRNYFSKCVPRFLLEMQFSTEISIIAILMFIPVANVYWLLATNPLLLSSLNWFYPNLWSSWTQKLDANFALVFPAYLTVALVYSFGALVAIFKYIYALKDYEGWRTAAFYNVLYCWMITVGFGTGIINALALFPPYNTLFYENETAVLPSVLVSVSVLLPPMVVSVVGGKKVFTYMARHFEYDLFRQRSDGALMAELAANSMVIDRESNSRWIFRQSEAKISAAKAKHINCINENFWMRGEILSVSQSTSTFSTKVVSKITKTDDKNDNYWLYNGRSMVQIVKDDSDLRVKVDQSEYNQWLIDNIDSSKMKEKDTDTFSFVIIEDTIKQPTNTRSGLLDWATHNLRCFKWEKFEDHLFHKSPRQLRDDEEKAYTYSFSVPLQVNKHSEKIDYFISHSWDDDPAQKCKVLTEFCEKFKKRKGRYPTFWFDKVCIDQTNPGNALAVLPINIGACKNVLVLMSKSYLRRLWCVWELFSLFTFCNTELALERIEILPIDGDGDSFDEVSELKSFDIDNAHCFDPNEEFKLRQIIHDIDLGRLTKCLDKLREHLDHQKKGHLWGNK